MGGNFLWPATLSTDMGTELLSEDEYAEYLSERDKPLTEDQEQTLQQITQAETLLRQYENELGEDVLEQTFTALRRRQIEVLTNEKMGALEGIGELLPDEISFNLKG